MLPPTNGLQSKIKVLVLTSMWPDDQHPGLGSFIRDQVESLKELGVEIDLCFIRGGYGNRFKYIRGVVQFLFHLIRHHDYDVVHAHQVLMGVVARFQPFIPIVLTHHGLEVMGGRGKVQAWLCKKSPHFADQVIVVSEEMRSALSPSSVVVIPCGVALHRFRELDRAFAREKLGIQPERRYVLFIGFYPDGTPRTEKRYDLALASIERAKEKYGLEIELLTPYGRPPDEMPLWINASEAVLLTSDQEGSPTIVKEAMACNVPVVSVDVGDVIHLIEFDEGSVLCMRTPDSLADGLFRALSLPNGRTTTGRECITPLSNEIVCRRLVEVYETVAKCKRDLARRAVV